ncbi:MAG: maleylpyruvate isomerase family mycothiol-dependent enzyme [Actinomycetota bacterium]|nr:maleylpyruvate isomerase family mycothiol-dependent enzyme [Actinomycetota bacterium]
MTRAARQYYEPPGAPLEAPATATEVVAAWTQHRARLRKWLHELPQEAWGRPTRCGEWTTTGLVEHLISGAQFLGYTLHQSSKGTGTNLLAAFDPQETPAAAAAQFKGQSRDDLLAALEDVDARVADEMAADDRNWSGPAEAPPGLVCARLSVNHFLFDSWVHERDLMVPAGESPALLLDEASAVLAYVVALAGAAGWADDNALKRPIELDVVADDLGICVRVTRDATRTFATFESDPGALLRAEGSVVELVDFATGRSTGSQLTGDPEAIAFLANLADVMS